MRSVRSRTLNGEGHRRRPRKKPDPKDPNSDVTAPQLMGVEFVPPAVHDGEETLLAITATDDISGVRTISGNIVSPSGALQGFALQREGEGSNRYFAKILGAEGRRRGAYGTSIT